VKRFKQFKKQTFQPELGGTERVAQCNWALPPGEGLGVSPGCWLLAGGHCPCSG